METTLAAPKTQWSTDQAHRGINFKVRQRMVPDAKQYAEISQFKRILNKFRYGLVFQVIRNKLAKVGIEFSPYYWFQAGIGDNVIPEIKGLNSEYSVEFLGAMDMKIIAENARGYSATDFLTRLKDGKLCLGLKHRHSIVSFMWIYLDECTYAPRKFLLKKDEAYITDMYTMESYRGNNFAPFLAYKNCEILYKMGRHKIFSASEYFNTSAVRYKDKLNAKKLELVLFISLFKMLEFSIRIKSFS
jgi:hypothetical protein